MPMVQEWEDTWELEDFSNAYRNWILQSMHAQGYGILFDILYDTEFEWDYDIPRDANRAADGRYLRLRFANESGMEIRQEWVEDWPCSFLEFMVALAYSIEDRIMYDPEGGDRAHEWFWEMMRNVGLDRYGDAKMSHDGSLAFQLVISTVQMVMWRGYDYNGNRGLFPLRKPAMDQRDVEIWYQANAYFTDKYFE